MTDDSLKDDPALAGLMADIMNPKIGAFG